MMKSQFAIIHMKRHFKFIRKTKQQRVSEGPNENLTSNSDKDLAMTKSVEIQKSELWQV